MHNRDQFLQLVHQLLANLEEPIPFLLRDSEPLQFNQWSSSRRVGSRLHSLGRSPILPCRTEPHEFRRMAVDVHRQRPTSARSHNNLGVMPIELSLGDPDGFAIVFVGELGARCPLDPSLNTLQNLDAWRICRIFQRARQYPLETVLIRYSLAGIWFRHRIVVVGGFSELVA